MNDRHGSALSGAFVFLLLGVFALMATLLTLLGARAYQSTVDRTESHSAARVLESYIANAVRADDAAGAIYVESIQGMDVLRIAYDFDGEAYDKWIYCHDGSLCELFTGAEFGFDPAAGEAVCPADHLQLRLEDGLIYSIITEADGRELPSVIALRCAA